MKSNQKVNRFAFLSSAILIVAALLVVPQTDQSVQAGQTEFKNGQKTLVEAAREIDRLVQADLKRNNLSPNSMASDSDFLRRVYLDVVGRIPDIKETRAFLRSKSPNKRAELIERLFESPGYVSHNFNFWADTLRIKTRLNQQVSGEPFMHWMKESLQKNKPYNDMVHEMLAAEGAANKRGNGATGYLLRDRGMPLDAMANTIRVFLGTRVECAQCHNHPFADWTQRQFFEMAAFFGGVQYTNSYFQTKEGRQLMRAGRSIREKQGEQAFRNYRRQIRRILQPGLSNGGTGVSRLPGDYQYDDGKPGDYVLARTIFGEQAHLDPKVPVIPKRFAERMKKRKNKNRGRQRSFAKDIGSRKAFADWVVADDNPMFASVITNRLWEKVFGMALVPDVDDMRDDTKSVNPQLNAYLETLMKQLNYDMKAFQKVLVMTRTYQRKASPDSGVLPGSYHFQGPLARRMTAEQMWDSMLTLVVPNIDNTINEPMSARAKAVYDLYDEISSKSSQEILAQFTGGDGMQSGTQLRRKRAREMQQKLRPIRRALVRARRKGDKEAEEKALAQLRQMGIDPERADAQRRYGRDLLRASELPSPTPPGHFLREFGQSDRDTAENAFTSANVPQVLNLVNGFVEDKLLAKDQGMMMTAIRKAKNNDQKIRTAFLFILNRQPTQIEMAQWRKDVKKLGEPALDDLIWTLVNCHEFRQVN